MKTYIYRGGFPIVEKSGVGKAIEHQEKMLNAVEAPRAARWKEATVVHMNTVFPDSVIAAFIAKMQKKKVIYYGHSTMEDFKNSFIGSNLAAPIFKKLDLLLLQFGGCCCDANRIFQKIVGRVWIETKNLFDY